MLTREVYWCRLDARGRPAALVSRTASWSPRTAEEVAADIVAGRARYVVPWEGGPAEVVVRRTPGGGHALDAPGPDGRPGGLTELPTA